MHEAHMKSPLCGMAVRRDGDEIGVGSRLTAQSHQWASPKSLSIGTKID